MLDRRTLLAAGPAFWWATRAHAAQLELLAERPAQLQTPVEAFDQLITPNDVFFVRSHHGPPRLDRSRTLKVSGLVESSLALTQQMLESLPRVTVTAVLQCAGNGRALMEPPVPGAQWTHGAMGQAEWTGARLRDVLAAARPKAEATHVWLTGADLAPRPATPQFVRDLPMEKALHPDTLVAWQMNGEPLSLAHGAPFRLVVPGWAGSYWLKWLTQLELAATEQPGFFVQKGYRTPNAPIEPGAKVPPEQMVPVTVMPVKSVLARPLDGAVVTGGHLEVAGVAFSGFAEIARVEVSLDGKKWQPVRLQGKGGVGRWQLFHTTLEVKRGTSGRVMSRATDKAGNVQPEHAAWNPGGYHHNALHVVNWSAR